MDTKLNKLQTRYPPENWLIYSGLILIVSGLIHVLVMFYRDGAWEGAVSWRKPILFGISTGLTMVSLGWLLGRMHPTKYDRWLAPLVSTALVIEVGLITVQQWRGIPSHFNDSTTINRAVDQGITVLIAFAALVIFDFTRRSFGTLNGAPDIRMAARSGMAFLSLSCLIGFAILIYGKQQQAAGNSPELVGESGVLKFPHGIAIHAIQLFPVMCWFLSMIGVASRRRVACITWASISMGTLLLFSGVQTVGGRARFDLTPASGTVMVVAILCLLPIMSIVLSTLGRRIR